MSSNSIDLSHSPLISIVTINFNNLEPLKKTFASVVAQTESDREYVIIDGGSQDGTIEYLESHDESIDYWSSERDRGIYDAMNKGVKVAKGEWIIFMNSGDLFVDASTLQQISAYLDSSVDVILGSVESIYDDRYGYRTIVSQPQDLAKIWHQIPACHQSVLVRRELLLAHAFDTTLGWCADHDCLAQLYSLQCRFKVVPIVIAKFEASGDRQRDLLSYTRERWQIYHRYFDRSLAREWFFVNEFRSFWIQQNINTKIRAFLPKEWIDALRKLRGI